MSIKLPTPRLLPATICVIAAVLASRTTVLVRTVIIAVQPTALVGAAWASGAEAPGAKPETHAAPTGAKPGEPAKAEHAAEKKPDAPKAGDKPPTIDGPPPVTDGERAVLLELRQRRQELEAREATLAARESMLTAANQKLSSRVEELQGLQKKLESLDAGHKQQEDAAWQGLVKVYETMKPRDAATIFNDLGMQVLLAVVDRMKEAKAAAILAAMTPDKAREVTMQLAQSRSRTTIGADAGGKPAPSPLSAPISAPGPGKALGSGT
jgi:flagellar motility protein MotE (MotC chaperone)